MKLSVRTKVANGLVICLLIPRVGSTAVDMFEKVDQSLKDFAADDEFVLGSEYKSFAVMDFQAQPSGDPVAGLRGRPPDAGSDLSAHGGGPPPHPGGDPSGHTGGPPPQAGGDPTAHFDPSACEATNENQIPTLYIAAPERLVTAECDPSGGGVDPSGHWDPSGCSQLGGADFFEVSMYPAPKENITYQIVSSRPDEAKPVQDTVKFDEYSCVQKIIWVDGQDDGMADGDQDYVIEVFNKERQESSRIPGINLDDDNYKGVNVMIPEPIWDSEKGVYHVIVDVENSNQTPVSGNDLLIQVTPKLAIKSYSVIGFKGKVRMKPHELVFSDVGLSDEDLLSVELEVVPKGGGPQQQRIFATFQKSEEGLMNSENQIISPKSR
ncbi:hypothetical protein ACFL00_02160 [Pseudomonadota bacterium]